MTIPPYANPNVTQPYASPAPTPAAAPNAIGKAALVVGIVALAMSFALTILRNPALMAPDHAVFEIMNALGYVPSLLGVIALGFGLTGISRRGSSMIAASIGTGIGVALVGGALTSLLFNLALSAGF